VASASLKDAATVQLLAKGEIPQLPAEPGVYAVYNNAGELQYIGLSRKVCQPLRLPKTVCSSRLCQAVVLHLTGAPVAADTLLIALQVSVSLSNHLQELPELTAAVKYEVVPSGAREDLTAAWKTWMEEACECSSCCGVLWGRREAAALQCCNKDAHMQNWRSLHCS
jgi:hypothetical protein